MTAASGTARRRRRAVPLVAVALACAFLAGGAVSRRSPAVARRPPVTAAPAGTGPRNAPPVPGPAALVAGVPAGFARSPVGAVSAAAAFVTSGQALFDVDPLAAETAVRQMASTAGADRQVRAGLEDLARLRDGLRSGSGPIVFRQAVLAVRVIAATDTAATVEVWSVGVLARRGVAPPQAGWRTSRLELVWERGDWHLDRETVAPGPAPVLDDSAAPSTADQLLSAVDDFDPVTTTARLEVGS